jgi:adenylate kinase
MKIVLIGIQGSGKSTQGNLLSEKLGIPYLSTGHIFREIAHEKTPLGRYIKETMNSGYLIPDDKTLEIVDEYLSRPEYAKGYILDGFPRTTEQAERFKNGIGAAVYIKVSDEEAMKRLSFREDDREDSATGAIMKRIEIFHKFTEPVIEYYRHKGTLIEVNGEESIEDVHNKITTSLNI